MIEDAPKELQRDLANGVPYTMFLDVELINKIFFNESSNGNDLAKGGVMKIRGVRILPHPYDVNTALLVRDSEMIALFDSTEEQFDVIYRAETNEDILSLKLAFGGMYVNPLNIVVAEIPATTKK